MQQYFAGRKRVKVESLATNSETSFEDLILANERVDKDWIKSHLKIHNSTFAKMGFRSSEFQQCDLSFCVFIDCYFKKALFDQVNFTGCIFINCNFDMATFISCDFKYATFESCFISFDQMKGNLPYGKNNLCADICRNLSLQSLSLGSINDYKAYLFEERASGEIHSLKKLFHKGDSYYRKYSLFDGIKGFLDFLGSKASKYLWGYGEKMGTLLRNMLIVIFVYGMIYFFYLRNCFSETVFSNNFISAMYLSACNFFSFSCNIILESSGIHVVQLSEHIIGLILMGFFGAALFRQINRR